ncbi:carbohydrate-binding module family 50 protein [Hyaloscypha hepaticicola]|uniref:chitinase n=1 Tax=Hyaloscypha hepaticicola TaxID=2082293 RepID=A0A2J6PS70_9HELO|nr:carbohydrate-binding module family 50 protein [Hyaloscypha hepaticicola]
MASFWSLTIVSLTFLINFTQATYDASAHTNLAVYWGQGAYQQRLLHFCNQSTIDIIPIGFVNYFPAQGNGFPGDNFGNQCSGPPYVYAGPGNDPADNQLQSNCPNLVADIPVCQAQYGKKIVLSLGGGIDTYGLTGAANGTAFADFLWGAFGPQTKAWLKEGLPRPFDGPNNQAVEVDGFDFDIEFPSSDNQAGYIAMIKRLRQHFGSASKKYIITGAPQCVVPDANMGQMITYAKFDIIWIQYYNTAQCSARNWVTANPNYLSTGIEEPSGFSFDAWEGFLEGTASQDAKLYIGLPAATNTDYYLSPSEASSLIKAYYCKPNFGGIMLWEATAAENNDVGCGETYYQAMKEILVDYSQDGSLSCVKAPKYPISTSSKASCTVTSTTTSSSAPTITPTPPCTKVYQVQSGDYCYLIWTEFGITEAQLYAWNPFLDAACDLQPGEVLCVAESTTSISSSVSVTTTSTSVSATPTACTKYYTVVSGDYCYLIETDFGITSAQLYAWNPTLDANCDLAVGQVLCVSESPTSTSSVSTTTTSTSVSATPTACTKHYTVVSGDYCYLIETNFGITSAQLYAWNPTLDANCDLSIGQVLCVSESPTSTSSSSTQVSTTSTSSTSSSPTAACTKTYKVVSGDYCYLIETNFGITSAQLYAWNPTLDANCDLSIGQILCVSESPVSSSSSTLTSTSSTKSSSSSSSSHSSTHLSTSSSSSRSSTSSTKSSTSTSSSPTPTPTPKLVCNSDNCLRQLRGTPAFATTFCASFTAAVHTATVGLPTDVANCQSDVGRISSACSCLGVSTATTLSTSMTAAKR